MWDVLGHLKWQEMPLGGQPNQVPKSEKLLKLKINPENLSWFFLCCCK